MHSVVRLFLLAVFAVAATTANAADAPKDQVLIGLITKTEVNPTLSNCGRPLPPKPKSMEPS